MAKASQKKIIANNLKTLKDVHTLSAVINSITALMVFYFKRPLNFKPFIIFSIPLIVCEGIVESIGRPKGNTMNTVQDLSSSGLTEIFFLMIYFGLFENILLAAFGSNKVYWLYAIVGGFFMYKGFQLLKMGKNLLGLARGGGSGGGNGNTASNESENQSEQEPTKSKRQLKRESQKDKVKHKYVR